MICSDKSPKNRTGSGRKGTYDPKGRVERPSWVRALKAIGDFKRQTHAPVFIAEYGVYRWQSGAKEYLKDELQVFDELGVPSAIWLWESADPDVTQDVFNYRKGPVANNHIDAMPNPLMDLLQSYWDKSG